jgi:hypothetical protein
VARGISLVLLAATALAGGPTLKQLLDPAHEDFPLRHYTWDDWEGLDKAERLRSRGTDPEEWKDPPPDPEAEKEAEERRKRAEEQGAPKHPRDRWPGFRFAERLEAKKAAFEAMIQPASASKLEGLVKQLDELDKSLARYERGVEEVREKYQQLAEQHSKAASVYSENYRKQHGKYPETVMLPASLIRDFDQASLRLQEVMAVRQSEEQFHDWLLLRLATLLGELSDEERKKPVAALAKGIADEDWVYRIRCARLLGQLGDPLSVATFRDAMAKGRIRSSWPSSCASASGAAGTASSSCCRSGWTRRTGPSGRPWSGRSRRSRRRRRSTCSWRAWPRRTAGSSTTSRRSSAGSPPRTSRPRRSRGASGGRRTAPRGRRRRS